MIDAVLKITSFAQANLNDVVILSKSTDDIKTLFQNASAMINGHRLKQKKIYKCEFSNNTEKLLDHIVGTDGVSADQRKLVAIQDAPVPFL